VRDPPLDVAEPRAVQAHDELGVDEEVVGLERELVADLGPHQLERAVDVADVEVEDAADEAVPRVGVHPAHERVHAREPVADDEVVAARPSIVRRAPNEKELQGWIDQSKKLPKVVEH